MTSYFILYYNLSLPSKRLPGVEILLVLVVEPSLNDTLIINGDEWTLLLLRQLAKVVRHEPSVNVAHSRARHPLNAAAALPYLRVVERGQVEDEEEEEEEDRDNAWWW